MTILQGNVTPAVLRICCYNILVKFTVNSLSHMPMGVREHLHGDGEHAGVSCEGHAGCEHHLFTMPVKGTVVRAPGCGQGEGNIHLFLGFPAWKKKSVFW